MYMLYSSNSNNYNSSVNKSGRNSCSGSYVAVTAVAVPVAVGYNELSTHKHN